MSRLMPALFLAAPLALLLGLPACTPLGVAVGAGAMVASAAGEERGLEAAANDTRIRAAINNLWLQTDHVIFGNLSLAVYEGRVMITGLAPTPEARDTAVRLASQVAGVREVLDEVQVQDHTYAVDYSRDAVMAGDIRGKLLFDSAIKNVNYSVEVVNGVVYLFGVARSRDEMQRVIGHARNVEYVRRIVNHIILADDPRRAVAAPR